MYHVISTCFSLSCEYFNTITAIQVLLHILSLRCPRLELLSLRKTGTASAILHCPSLTKLNVCFCQKPSDGRGSCCYRVPPYFGVNGHWKAVHVLLIIPSEMFHLPVRILLVLVLHIAQTSPLRSDFLLSLLSLLVR